MECMALGSRALPVKHLLVHTGGSAVFSAGWPRAVCKAGWAAACLRPNPVTAGGLLFLGAAFAPVLLGAQVPGSFGVMQPSASATEFTAVAAALALLRSRLGAVVPALSVATDCKYAVEVPQLRAWATANHALARVARAELEARACSGQVQIVHPRAQR